MKKNFLMLTLIVVSTISNSCFANFIICWRSSRGGTACEYVKSQLSCKDPRLKRFFDAGAPLGWACQDVDKTVFTGTLIYMEGKASLKLANQQINIMSDNVETGLIDLINRMEREKLTTKDIDVAFARLRADDKGIVSLERAKAIAEELKIPILIANSKSLRGTSFTEPKDFTLNNPALMKVLGYESITIKGGNYQIDKEGSIVLNIVSTGKETSPVSNRIINPTQNPIKEYRGKDCVEFGFSCCVYSSSNTNELVSYQFVVRGGKPVQLRISFRGSGSPRQAGF